MNIDFKKIKQIDLYELSYRINGKWDHPRYARPEYRSDFKSKDEELKFWRDEFLSDSDACHYKLLAYLSLQVTNGLIVELGTHIGLSSTALSINPINQVLTYDLGDNYTADKPRNVQCLMGDIFKLNQQKNLLDADFIFLDTSHKGDFEEKVFNYLKNNNYKNFMICDDIGMNDEMKAFWNKVPNDIKRNHIFGTGLIDFGKSVKIFK